MNFSLNRGLSMKLSNAAQRSIVLAALMAVGASSALAQDLKKVVAVAQQKNVNAKASQKRIDTVVEKTRTLEDQFATVTKEVDGLIVYNRLLNKQISDQEKAMQALTRSMDQVSVLERQVTPLMVRMIDTLEEFVALDVPFLQKERKKRIEFLKEMMERSDVSVAEKFRRVFEAYQIENEYGRTIETYKGTMKIDGGERAVEILKIGRVGLYYQTTDAGFSGYWDQSGRKWRALGSEYRNPIREGIRIANKQVAPNLLMLPVNAAEKAQ